MTKWISHLAGLIGASNLTVNGTGVPSDPWTIPVIPFDAQSALALAVSVSGSTLQTGVQASLAPGSATGPGSILAEAVIAAIPLGNTGNATVLPAASILFQMPGSGSGKLVSSGTFSVDSLRAGLHLAGSSLQPMVVMTNVVFDGTNYAQLDLTNADSVRAAGATAVQTAITNALGAASPLASLIGLAAPSGDPSSTHRVDLTALVSNPAGAIASFHREVLLDGQRWSFLLDEIAGILGLTLGTTGTGTQSDPWLIKIASSGAFTLNLAAWNAQKSTSATDPQQLRLGLRAVAVNAPVTFSVQFGIALWSLICRKAVLAPPPCLGASTQPCPFSQELKLRL